MALISRLPSGGDSGSANKLNLFTQETEPTTYNGIWIQTNQKHKKVVTDTDWWLGGEYDLTSNFVQNLSAAISSLGGTGCSGFFKYNNDYYITYTKGYSDYLYKIVSEDGVNVSLQQLINFAGSSERRVVFNHYMYWCGNVTGNGQSNTKAYLYDFDTNKITQLLDEGRALDNCVVFKDKIFGITDTTLFKINIDLNNPTSISYTNLGGGLGDTTDLCVYNGELYGCIEHTASGISRKVMRLVKIKFDESLTTFELENTNVIAGLNDSTYINFRSKVHIMNNGHVLFMGGYNSRSTYMIIDIKDGSVIQSGVTSDIMYSSTKEYGVVSNHLGYWGDIIETASGLFGCFSKDGVIKYSAESKQYGDDTVIISKSDPVVGSYYTEFVGFDGIEDYTDGTHIFKTGFNDVLYYHNDNLDDSLPTYYGDGTKWIKFKN